MENEITKKESNENTRNFIEQFEVEDIIYKYGSTLKHENLVHSFVLDTDDKKIRNLFSENEWNEILKKKFWNEKIANNRVRSFMLYNAVQKDKCKRSSWSGQQTV